MSATVIPVPTSSPSDNYVLISSVSPTAAASTVSFTGISGYRKLMFRWLDTTLATAGYVSITFNSDTGTNYNYARVIGTSTISNSVTFKDTKIVLEAATSTSQAGGFYIIDGITSTGPKTFTGFGNTSGSQVASINGFYVTSSAITTATLVATTTFSGAGTVALYGVAS